MTSLQEDSRQQAGKHDTKHEWWASNGVPIVRCKLPFGDYAWCPDRAVDTKSSIYELAMDIDQQHDRFKRECIGARDAGCSLTVLVENEDGVRRLEDLLGWEESDGHFAMRKRKSGNARARKISGERLAKACRTMEMRYGVGFAFCAPDEAAMAVVAILKGEWQWEKKGSQG